MRAIYVFTIAIFIVFGLMFNGLAAEGADPNSLAKIKLPSKSVSIAQSLSAFEKAALTQPEILQALNRHRKSLSIVFVPGILGSKLEDSKGVIWGKLDIKYLFVKKDYDHFLERLSLPPALIDEHVVSNIKATILEEMAGVDLYGKAVKAMKSQANKLGIEFTTCGYDWRRDIRAGAADLDRCVQERFGANPRNLIIVAHSMGGLVSWVWAMQHERGVYGKQHNIVQVVILGSPLDGSCEIVRMIQDGYVQPTKNDEVMIASNRDSLPNPTEWLVTLMDRLRNSLTSALSKDIRPLILTWPGAIELTPKPTNVKEAFNCERTVANPNNPFDKKIISYYEPQFWQLKIGQELLAPYKLPKSYEKVLAKAGEFRKSFTPHRLKAPTWLYYSEAWLVPNEVSTILKDNVVHLGDRWTQSQGDGRVPRDSAMMISSPTDLFSYGWGIPSVHGNLPADPNFLKDYFEKRLPKTRDAFITLAVAKDSLREPAWIKGYLKAGGGMIDESELKAVFDPNPFATPSASTMKATDTLRAFDQEACKYLADGCAKSYKEAKAITAKRVKKLSKTNASIMQMGSAARNLGSSHQNYAFAEGNKGMLLAKMGKWNSAAVSLNNAADQLDNLPKGSTPENQAVIDQFQIAVIANQAKALYLGGYCKKAAPLLRETKGYWSFSRDALKLPCNDVSGLLYCFGKDTDTDDYCRKK